MAHSVCELISSHPLPFLQLFVHHLISCNIFFSLPSRLLLLHLHSISSLPLHSSIAFFRLSPIGFLCPTIFRCCFIFRPPRLRHSPSSWSILWLCLSKSLAFSQITQSLVSQVLNSLWLGNPSVCHRWWATVSVAPLLTIGAIRDNSVEIERCVADSCAEMCFSVLSTRELRFEFRRAQFACIKHVGRQFEIVL